MTTCSHGAGTDSGQAGRLPLYNRWRRWSDNGVFARILVVLAAESAEHKTIMIDATYLKALFDPRV